MKSFSDWSFVAAYGKYALVALVGAAISAGTGVPTYTAATLAFGAIVGFPIAYGLGRAADSRAAQSTT
jgi:hypothetical protein